jgi:ParB family transcriptional regulator, chromosome partitioning protein
MSKADKLGAGASFGKARPVSARRAAISAATAAPTASADVPPSMPPGRISLNPDNPREKLGDLRELAASLRDHGQKQACSIMTRQAYVAANPGREKELEEGTDHVVIDGNRRLAAVREVGLVSVKVTVDDTLGHTPDEILESSLVANIHREAFEPLEEAKALRQLLAIHGTQDRLAQRLHRSQGWVSQRLSLLDLTPALQRRLEEGQEPVDLLRSVGKKPKDRQEEELKKLKIERAGRRRKKEEGQAGRRASKPSEAAQNVGNTGGAGESHTEQAATPYYAVMETEEPIGAVEPRLPWDSPPVLDRLLRQHMSQENRLALAKLLAE